MADIFISYSKRDPQLTIALAKDLEAQGYTTWWDTSLLPGDEFPEKIRQELNKAKAVIVIWTPASIASSWVQAEALIANEQNKLITLRSDDLDPRSIPLPYNIRHAALHTNRTSIYAALGQREGLIPYGDGLNGELIALRQTFDDIIRSSGNIINYTEFGCFDTKSVDVKHDISDNGDTFVEALLTIECTNEPAHFYRYWIDADPESQGVDYFRVLRFEVTDSDTGRKLDFLPIKNGARNKMFAIFFPEVAPGKQMTLRICYVWPGFLRNLIELGATNFSWRFLSKSPNSRAPLTMEWNFSNKLAKLNCRIAGRQSNTATVFSEFRVNSTAWIYSDTEAYMNEGTIYTVEFARKTDLEIS